MRGFLFVALVIFLSVAQAKNLLTGINLSGAAFSTGKIPGVSGTDYFWPTNAQMDYFFNKNMNVVRFPVLWERLQATLNGPLQTSYSNSLANIVSYVTTTKGKYIIIDVHNYREYRGDLVGESGGNVTTANLLDLYTKLTTLLNPYGPRVIYGIMNEPHGSNYPIWRQICQDFINHMRAIGNNNLLLIPGLSNTGAGSWGTSNNYHDMWNLTDPANNFAMELHMYPDSDSSGTSDKCVSATVGADRLKYATEWMRAYNRKAFLGEYGAGRNTLCYSTINNTFAYMEQNSDVWLGWTWWAGGPNWGSYIYTLTPYSGNQDPPQWPYITPYIATTVPAPTVINAPKNYPRAGDIKIPIYNGVLNMMSDSSWATGINRKDTTRAYSSPNSYSFIPGGTASNAMQWVCGSCFDTTLYSGLELYIWTTGSLSNLQIRMVDYIDKKWSSVPPTTTVAALATGPADVNGWTRVFMNFSIYDGGRHGGFMIFSGSARPTAYIDAVSLIHHLDQDLV